MASYSNPNHALAVQAFFLVSVSVSSSGSAVAAGVGPFRGLFFKASSTCTIIGNNGNSLPLDNVPKNTFIWISGAYLSAIVSVSCTDVFAII